MKPSRLCLLAVLTVGILFAADRSVSAKDEWIQVKSKNFFLIGNASEKDIRKVATRLEQFRETFRQVFGKTNLTSPITTNVVVFKSDSSYKNFKPRRADGKIDTFVAGYFQPGEDVNYITLTTEGEDAQTFSVIFHEYVHFIIETNFGKSEIPAWFNEGLAEYYSTFAIENDIEAKLGLTLDHHLLRLQQSKFMPLDQLFKISNYQLLQSGDHSRSIFYSESWALIHYLIQSGKTDALGKFLNFLLDDIPPEKAFQDAFQIGYQKMESELRKYVSQNKYFYSKIVFKNKLLFDAETQASPLDEAASNAYLGDLLLHTNRADDAEPYLLAALKLQPESGMANVALGMVRIKQRKFGEAKQCLEKAIAGDPKNHLAYFRYAYILSREGLDEFGFVRSFDAAAAAKMREALRKAIAINPAFTESYELLAFVNLVNVEELDEAAKMIQTALKYQPGNQRYALRLAEVLSRQNKLDEANAMAEKISRTSDAQDIKTRAESLMSEIARHKAVNDQNAALQKRNGTPGLIRRTDGKPPNEVELAKLQKEATLRAINESLRNLEANEQRVVGYVQKIDCRSRPIVFTIKAADSTFTITGKDFESLTLQSFDAASNNVEIGCDANLSALNAVVTFMPETAKGSLRGAIRAIEFVPENFHIMSADELSRSANVVSDQSASASNDDDARRRAMMAAMRDALPKPAAGQKREMGFLDKIECTKKGNFFYLRTAAQTLKLLNSSPESLQVVLFVRDLEGMQFGCALKPVEYPVVFIYNDKPDVKAKTAGEIVSLGFVPQSFVLDDGQ